MPAVQIGRKKELVMSNLFRAMETRDAFTENGMITHSSSGKNVLDLFYKMGGWRGQDVSVIEPVLIKAFCSDALLTTKAIFYNRDIRGGQGERNTFRHMFKWLCLNYPDVAILNLPNVPFYGRWDDILVALDTPIKISALKVIAEALTSGDALCAKWMPRDNKKNRKYAFQIMEFMGLKPKEYRKLLVRLTNVVETAMCRRKWTLIDYSKIPSNAISKYRKAFYRNDITRFKTWVERVASGDKTVKINAGAIFPHDIARKFITNTRMSLTEEQMVNEQWKALPNYIKEGDSFIPVCDVSGSMNGLPLEVCVSLGIYLSERNKSIFKDGFITFSGNPTLQILSGSLKERVRQLKTAHWQMNTNLEKVFSLILDSAKRAGLSNADMPKNVLILSDMQFDECVTTHGASAMDMIRRKYSIAGYTVPNVIFWNLRTSEGVPAKFDENGTALVSGFSPSAMENLLGGNMNPESAMLKKLNSPRYERVTVWKR